MKVIINKNKHTPLPLTFSFDVPNGTDKDNSITPKTILKTPRPIWPIKTDLHSLVPSSKMTEANGTTTAPLELSAQEWSLLNYVVDPPTRVLPPLEMETRA